MVLLAHDTEQLQRTNDIKITENVAFDTMFLAEKTLSGLRNSGFYKPSPIQLLGIPLGKCGFDLLLEAKSGTGKTAVFTIIGLEKINLRQGLQTVILAPTREIAAQICDVVKQIGSSYDGLHIEVVMGGLPVQDDIKKFEKNVQIVVGSPGRLRHLIQDKHVDVSSVRFLVLDEADKLMEKAFQADINYIFSVLPRQKQVIMSSATYSEIAKDFINNYVQNAQHVCPESNSVLLGVTHYVTTVKYNSNIVRLTQNRFEDLHKILNKKEFKQCLIFCNYHARVVELSKMLIKAKWPVEQLYGQQDQQLRLDALKTLQEYKCRILVSTDLAARGIDASNVDLIINFEPPFEWQTYLHRIGRAGRFGSYGTAITILNDGNEQHNFKEMLGFIKFPLKLRDFWSDSLFSFDDNKSNNMVFPDIEKQKSVRNINNSSEGEKLWEILMTEYDIETDETQSFENLCHSFEKSERNNIDSFADLVDSFKNNECEYSNLDSNYRIFNFNEFQIKSLSEADKETLKNHCQSSMYSLPNHTSNSIEVCTGSQNGVSNYNKEETSQLIQVSRHSKTPNDSINNVGHSEGNVSTLKSNNLNKCELNGIGVKEMKSNEFKSLIDDYGSADVPTAFCSSKDKHKSIKSRKDKNFKFLHPKVDLWPKQTIKSIEDKRLSIKTKHNKSSCDKMVEIIPRNNLSENCHPQYSDQNLKNKVGLETRKSNSATLPNNNSYNNSNSNISRDYDIWYNKLKSQMAHVELAIYFDEISKNCHTSSF